MEIERIKESFYNEEMNLALHGNWVDLVILVVLAYFLYQGFANGFWSILVDFVSFFGALLIALKTYKFAASFFVDNFSFTRSLANAFGYLATAIIAEIIISLLFGYLVGKLPKGVLKNKINRILGIALSFGQGIILIVFVLTFAIILPINPAIKGDISNSRIGGFIVNETTGIKKVINDVFGGAINDSLTYLTVEPASHESLAIDSGTLNLSVDNASETKMFQLVNEERTSRGINALAIDERLVKIARDYATLMWNQHFFGHYDKEGHDISYRLEKAGISYQVAGENLALAPTVDIAETGLMNSPGHRANILDKDFHHVGIGVIDNGYYGKMFVQEFTN